MNRRPTPPHPPDQRSPSGSLASSLLVRVRAKEPEAWRRMTLLYQPIVLAWCRRAGLQESDAEDVAQEVMQAVAKSIERFRRENENDSFRGWLFGVTRNKIQDFRRRAARSPQAVGGTDFRRRVHEEIDPLRDDESVVTTAADISALFRRALDLIRTDFQEQTWRAFWLTAIQGRKAAEAAAELGISPGAVYVAKSRVVSRLREEFGGLEQFDR